MMSNHSSLNNCSSQVFKVFFHHVLRMLKQGIHLIPTTLIFLIVFHRNERENALLSVIEETRHDTFESAERQHW